MRAVVSSSEMREIEQRAEAGGLPKTELMQRAGSAVAERAAEMGGDGAVVVLAGPGNNGGDGMVAARRLREMGRDVSVVTFRRGSDTSWPESVSADSDAGLREASARISRAAVVVDALLGTGATRPLEGSLYALVDAANQGRRQGAMGIAIDIPTGVHADTGQVASVAFRAHVTLCMGALKPGVLMFPGAEYAGTTQVFDLGISTELLQGVKTSAPDDAEIRQMLPKRGSDSNKGTFGRVLVIGGSRLYCGAPALVALGAYRAGAGLVEAAVPVSVQPSVAAQVLEVIFQPLEEDDGRISLRSLPSIRKALDAASSVVVGPGIGSGPESPALVEAILHEMGEASTRAVVDADGLNALARVEDWHAPGAQLVLTPHPGEMSRLTKLSIAAIQGDRLVEARRWAETWQQVVVLKGAATIVASPDGRASINCTGGPNLATAGSGDVLSGIIGALLAQGMGPFEAAVIGAYLHGRAGDLVRGQMGDAGTLASDLPGRVPLARQSIFDGAKVIHESP